MSPLLLLLSSTALAQVAGGTLVVNVPNAPGEIMLDGFPTGKDAPATLENVAPGTHLLQMEYGCLVGELEVTVAADKTVELTLPMSYKGGTGTVRLKGLPNVATVLVDDTPVRSWAEGVEAKCGSRTITIESPGFEDWSTDAIVTSGKWLTITAEMVEAAIVEAAPAPRADTRPVDDFEDDYDELDELDAASAYDELDELSSGSGSRDKERDRELERRQAEQEERRLAEVERRREADEARRAAEQDEADRRRAAEEARRRQEEAERKARYGDIDSLDGDDEDEEPGGRRRDADDEDDDYDLGGDRFSDEIEVEEDGADRRDDEYLDDEFDDEDTDRFDDDDDEERDEVDELDGGSSGRQKAPREAREPRSGGGLDTAKVLKYGGTGALAAVAVGGGVMAIVSGIQYSTGKGYWDDIVGATGVGSEQEITYWRSYVQPYKTRAIIGGVMAGVGLAGAGAWFFIGPDGTVQVGYTRRF